MALDQRLYLLLEIEKVRQNHRHIPTTFVYPLGGLSFSCCTYIVGGLSGPKPDKIVYKASKKQIHEPWDIELCNKRTPRAFLYRSDCLYDTLEHYCDFLGNTAYESIDADCGMWASSNGLLQEDVVEALKEHVMRLGGC